MPNGRFMGSEKRIEGARRQSGPTSTTCAQQSSRGKEGWPGRLEFNPSLSIFNRLVYYTPGSLSRIAMIAAWMAVL